MPHLKSKTDNRFPAIKKSATTTTISRTVNPSIGWQANTGNRDSGIWSRPIAWLLEGSFILRFKKLEKRSPVMAIIATTTPIFHSSPINGANAVVNMIENKIPRIVFEDPKRGCRSKKMTPPSRDWAKSLPDSFFTITGIPFATVSRTSSCRINIGCMADGDCGVWMTRSANSTNDVLLTPNPRTCSMSALGQDKTVAGQNPPLSAVTPIADKRGCDRIVRFVPWTYIESASSLRWFRPVEISMVRHFELDCGHAFPCTCASIDPAVVG